MRLFALIILAFFASFLRFKGQRYVYSELIFLVSGIVLGMVLKGIDQGTYRFFELFLIGFFGIVYGMSLDIKIVWKNIPQAVKMSMKECFLGIFFLLVIVLLLHLEGMAMREKLSVFIFMMLGASPYFVGSVDRKIVVASFLLPAFLTLITSLVLFTYKGAFISLVALFVIVLLLKFMDNIIHDKVTALSVVLGASVIIPFIAIKFGESAFFYAFMSGILFTNIFKGKGLRELFVGFKEDEKLLFLVFLFIIGLYTNFNLNIIKLALIIFVIRLFFKALMAKIVYKTRDLRHLISQGALSLVIAIDVIGSGEIIKGVGAAVTLSYLLNLLLTGYMNRRV